MTVRKKRSDSTKAAVERMANAGKAMDPPPHVRLRDGDRPYWNAIVRARDYTTWTDNDLIQAGNLARCYADIERLQDELDVEGDVIVNAKGTQIVNPKHALLETLSRRAVALSRIVQVHAQATQGDSKAQKKRNVAQREAQQTVGDLLDDDDGLLAGPMH